MPADSEQRAGGPRVLVDRPVDGVAVVSFRNPPGGCMDDAMERELDEAVERLEGDEQLRVVVLTGAERGVFIRHYDVGVLETRARAMAARGLSFDPARPVPQTRLHKCLRRIETSPRIWIAAINGTAMGGGFEVALACDLRVAEEGDYPIGLPEVNIGLLPGAGGTQRLARLVGQARALELLLLGRVLTPAQALAAGLVGECVAGSARERALALARRLVDQPPRALAHVKRLVRQAAEGGEAAALERGLADERTLFCDLMVRPEAIERMAQMNEGRRRIEGPPLMRRRGVAAGQARRAKGNAARRRTRRTPQ